MNQFEIYNKIGKETELLSLNNHVPLKLNMFEVLNNIPQCNLMTETKVKNGFKFITSKRGRKNKNTEKDKEIVNKSLKNKVEHNKYCNDNVRRRIKALFNKYIIVLLNNIMKINIIINNVINKINDIFLAILFPSSPFLIFVFLFEFPFIFAFLTNKSLSLFSL